MELLNREQIKDRMIRVAATHWQVPENEIEANFDPLLVLILDVLAGEVENIGHQINDVQNSLLNELSTIMLPQSMLRAKPASCILTARPTEKKAVLDKEDNFSTMAIQQRPGAPTAETEVNFTPNGEVALYNLETGFLKLGGKLFQCNENGGKSLVHENPQEKGLINEIQFTLHAKESLNALEGLQLFFDLKGHSEAGNFYFALQHANLFINEQPASFTRGYYRNEQYETNLKDSLVQDDDYCRKIQKEVAALYQKQFITVGASNIASLPAQPAFLKGLPEKIQQEIVVKGHINITIQLSRHFTPEVLERLLVGVNAFPAINRNLEKINFKSEKWINIIPLPVKGSFLDIKSIEGIDGYKYKLKAGRNDDKIDEGQAIIRTTRIGKNSSRDLRNTINSLLEAIRDESAYFSKISNDFIATQLNDISKILARLQDRVAVSKDEKPSFQYALLRAKKELETVFIQYWSTTPAEAGSVKAAAAFRPVMHSKTGTHCFALTGTVGGVETYSDYTQKQMLVKQLTGRGKLVSREDIKLLCYELFGIKLQKVAVTKKMKVLEGPKTGISRVIEIELHLKEADYSSEELTYLQKLLQYQLETNSSFVFPFEITIVYVD